MKKIIGALSLAACATLIGASSTHAVETEENGVDTQNDWNLVWQDEFDGNSWIRLNGA